MNKLTRLGRRPATDLCTDDVVWQYDRNDGSRFRVRIINRDPEDPHFTEFVFYDARRLDNDSLCVASFFKTDRPTVYVP